MSMANQIKPDGGIVDILIIAQANRFRDGLKAIVQGLDWVGSVGTVAQWTAVPDYVQYYQPAVVIFDVDDLEPVTAGEAEALKTMCRQIKCLAIIDRAHQHDIAQAMGADVILLRGFTTETLYHTLHTLVVAYDAAVPVTKPLGQLPT